MVSSENNWKKEIMGLLKETHYLNKDILYLRNVKITEYDIKSAGWTVIKEKKLLSEEEIKYLDGCSKLERNVYVGKQIKNNSKINDILLEEFSKARMAFGVVNRIDSENVLSIKKDAIFLIKHRPQKLDIGYFTFVPKNTYTSYAYINGKEFFYNEMSGIDVKGIGEDTLEKSKPFLNYMKNIFKVSEHYNGKQLVKYLTQYSNEYLNRTFPIEVYRNIETGTFKLGNGYYIENYDSVDDIDISQNFIKYINPLIANII